MHFSEKKIIYQAMFIAVIVLKAQNCNMSLIYGTILFKELFIESDLNTNVLFGLRSVS